MGSLCSHFHPQTPTFKIEKWVSFRTLRTGPSWTLGVTRASSRTSPAAAITTTTTPSISKVLPSTDKTAPSAVPRTCPPPPAETTTTTTKVPTGTFHNLEALDQW